MPRWMTRVSEQGYPNPQYSGVHSPGLNPMPLQPRQAQPLIGGMGRPPPPEDDAGRSVADDACCSVADDAACVTPALDQDVWHCNSSDWFCAQSCASSSCSFGVTCSSSSLSSPCSFGSPCRGLALTASGDVKAGAEAKRNLEFLYAHVRH